MDNFEVHFFAFICMAYFRVTDYIFVLVESIATIGSQSNGI